MQLLESPIPPLTAAALRIKSVLSVNETNFNEKKIKFSHLLTFRAEVADLPLPSDGQPDCKISVFLRLP